MSQGLRRTGLLDSSARPYGLRRPHFSQSNDPEEYDPEEYDPEEDDPEEYDSEI